MAYYSGTAASLTALRTALLTHAQADGWVLTGDVLSKAGVYFQIQETATNITCLGCESNAVANPAPNVVSIGRIYQRTSYTTREISFPCNYEVFGFTQELYLVANYDVDSYQWMAFGKSSVPGLLGQGGWCCATIGDFLVSSSGNGPIEISSLGGGTSSFGIYTSTGAAFWRDVSSASASAHSMNSWVNHGLDGHGWTYNGSAFDGTIGIRHATVLLNLQPSVWNSEATLLPLRCYKERPSYKASLIADLANARHLRIDNLAPGDILTLGSDQWRVFPWYRMDATSRNGGTGVNHSGTFGWAIRYEGP